MKHLRDRINGVKAAYVKSLASLQDASDSNSSNMLLESLGMDISTVELKVTEEYLSVKHEIEITADGVLQHSKARGVHSQSRTGKSSAVIASQDKEVKCG